jgi:PPOX class probable FMN-dependent enzyme
MEHDRIDSVQALEGALGARKLPALLKSIDHLDRHCCKLLAESPFGVVSATDAAGVMRAWPVGGSPGFAAVRDERRFGLPRDAAAPAAPSRDGVGAIFFVPGLGETLRVNGRVCTGEDGLEIAVEEAFIHCAKALIRSKLWSVAPETSTVGEDGGRSLDSPAVRDFLARSPFAVVASADRAGAADVSPKGDPPGFARILDARHLALPDRVGNFRTDTFHNIIEDPRVALLFLAPGDLRTLTVTGRGAVTTRAPWLAEMAVAGKVPKAALVVEVEELALAPSQALAASGFWDPARHVDLARLPRMGDVLADHVRGNKQGGVAAKAIRGLVSGSMIERGLVKDYRDKLY